MRLDACVDAVIDRLDGLVHFYTDTDNVKITKDEVRALIRDALLGVMETPELNLTLKTGHLPGTFYAVDDEDRVHRVFCQRGQVDDIVEHWVALGVEGKPVILDGIRSTGALDRDKARFFEEREPAG